MTLIPIPLTTDVDAKLDLAGGTLTGPLVLQTPTGGFLTHDPSAFDADAGVFRFTAQAFANDTEARDNVVWRWGYNIANGGGRFDVSEPALAYEVETNWENPDPTIGMVMEAHLAFTDTAGAVHRPFSFMMKRDGTSVTGSIESSVFNFFLEDGSQALKFDFLAEEMRFTVPLTLYLDANARKWLQQKGTSTTYYSLAHINASNEVEIGEIGTPLRLPMSSLKLTAGTQVDPGATGTIGIGGAAGGAKVRIVGHNGDVLRLSETATGGDFRFYLDSGKLRIIDHAASRTLLQLAAGAPDKALVLTSAGRFSVGAGESPGSILHIAGALTLDAMTAPGSPSAGDAVLYHDTATGDVMVKINVGGTTKTATLVDYSALP